MLKRIPFYTVALILVALFLTAGCAKKDIVKKDEGVAPAPVTGQADQQVSGKTPTKPATVDPVHSSAEQEQASSAAQLQAVLNRIYFDFDSSGLSDAARSTLAGNAATLMKETSEKIRIEGNCDERGSAEYNLALGERRAKAAQQYLVTMGVKPDRLSIISYGKEKPAVQGSDEAAWAKNRRDEFVVVTK